MPYDTPRIRTHSKWEYSKYKTSSGECNALVNKIIRYPTKDSTLTADVEHQELENDVMPTLHFGRIKKKNND